MPRWTHHRFRSVWDLDAPPALVYARLEDPGSYPEWWPQVRRVQAVDEHSGTALIRSALPYAIHVTVTGLLPGRPLFRLNHALMMRAGHRALAARPAAGR